MPPICQWKMYGGLGPTLVNNFTELDMAYFKDDKVNFDEEFNILCFI